MTPRGIPGWIKRNVPEADTAEKRAQLARGLRGLHHLLQWPDGRLESHAATIAATNAASAAAVAAWDALDKALRKHPTYRGDIRRAIAEQKADFLQSGRYAAALRSVFNLYRQKLKMPKYRKPGNFRRALLVQAVPELRALLGVKEQRASVIVAAFAEAQGVKASAESLRITARDKRL